MIAVANTRTNHLALDEDFAETCWCTVIRHARHRNDWCRHYSGDRPPEFGSCRNCDRMILVDDPEFQQVVDRLWSYDAAIALRGLMHMAEAV